MRPEPARELASDPSRALRPRPGPRSASPTRARAPRPRPGAHSAYPTRPALCVPDPRRARRPRPAPRSVSATERVLCVRCSAGDGRARPGRHRTSGSGGTRRVPAEHVHEWVSHCATKDPRAMSAEPEEDADFDALKPTPSLRSANGRPGRVHGRPGASGTSGAGTPRPLGCSRGLARRECKRRRLRPPGTPRVLHTQRTVEPGASGVRWPGAGGLGRAGELGAPGPRWSGVAPAARVSRAVGSGCRNRESHPRRGGFL